jgi:hypothetical protein
VLVPLFLNAHEQIVCSMVRIIRGTDNRTWVLTRLLDCGCYLPLHVLCGRHLLIAKLRAEH